MKKSAKPALKLSRAKNSRQPKVFKERRAKSDRRKGGLDLIYQRLVSRNLLPERRKGDRRKDD